MKKYKELGLGIFMILVAVIYFAAATQIETRIESAYSARFLPYILSGFCLVLGLAQSFKGIKLSAQYAAIDDAGDKGSWKSVALVFLTITVYASLLIRVGFLIDTFVLTFVLMMLLAPKSKRKPVLYLIVSLIGTVAVYYLFRNVLHLMLPKGILG